MNEIIIINGYEYTRDELNNLIEFIGDPTN